MANVTPKSKRAAIPELIAKHRGNVSAIARALKIPRNTLYRQIDADPKLQLALADERERMLDNAEDKLGEAVDKGEAWAVCFTLKTQGQGRGYIEKQQIEQSGKLEQRIVVEYVDDRIESDN